MTRHTLSDAYESSQALLLAQATRPHAEPTSNVKIARNAREIYQFEVDVSSRDPDEALRKAKEMVADLDATYPASNGNGAS